MLFGETFVERPRKAVVNGLLRFGIVAAGGVVDNACGAVRAGGSRDGRLCYAAEFFGFGKRFPDAKPFADSAWAKRIHSHSAMTPKHSLFTGSGFRTARMHMHIVLRESDAGVNLFYLSFCFERTTV